MRNFDKNKAPWTDEMCETPMYHIFMDGYPVNIGHRLYIPKRDDERYIAICLDAAYRDGQHLVNKGEIEAFNIGMNCGTAAGQTINWPHIHLIPRWHGDVEDPTGGVRYVVPQRGNYRKDDYVNIKND